MPKSERKKFFDFVEKEKLQSLDKKNEDYKFQLLIKRIQGNREKYDGQWVTVDGNTLLANRTDPKIKKSMLKHKQKK